MDRHGRTPGVRHTFSTITEILSFLSWKHGHTVCFEVLVELPRVGMVDSHPTGNNVSWSETPHGGHSTERHHALCQLCEKIRPHVLSEL